MPEELSRLPDIIVDTVRGLPLGIPTRRRLRAPKRTPALLRASQMAQSLHFREQAGRYRRLARDCIDEDLRDGLLKLADEYTARPRRWKTGRTMRARPDWRAATAFDTATNNWK